MFCPVKILDQHSCSNYRVRKILTRYSRSTTRVSRRFRAKTEHLFGYRAVWTPKELFHAIHPRMAEFDDGKGNRRIEQDYTVGVVDSYPLPPDMDTNAALLYIFKHHSISSSKSATPAVEQVDSASFMKLVKNAPGLLTKRVTTQHVDVLFTKNKPRGERRLCFHNFLMALSDLATLRFPDEDPLTALQNLLTKHLFGLPLKKLAGSNDTAIGVERTAMLVRSDLQAPPKLLDDISDQIIEAHQEAAAASEKRNPSRVSKGAPNEGNEGR